MKVYLAGPMTGYPCFNIPAFDDAAGDLRRRGYHVVSPAELDDPIIREVSMSSQTGDLADLNETLELMEVPKATWGEFLARDVKLIADEGIEAIVCLPGWKQSKGARLETFIGRLLGLPIYHYKEGDWLEGIYQSDVDAAHGWRDGEGRESHLFYGDFWDEEIEEPSEPPIPDVFARAITDDPSVPSVMVRVDGNPLGTWDEVRITDPVTGGQKGKKLAQIGALDPLALLEVGKVAGFGAEKYDRFNYAKGYAWSLSFDALQRHLLQWAAGEETDDESGLSHLAHAAWHCLALMTFTLRERGTDDRLHRMLEGVA